MPKWDEKRSGAKVAKATGAPSALRTNSEPVEKDEDAQTAPPTQ